MPWQWMNDRLDSLLSDASAHKKLPSLSSSKRELVGPFPPAEKKENPPAWKRNTARRHPSATFRVGDRISSHYYEHPTGKVGSSAEKSARPDIGTVLRVFSHTHIKVRFDDGASQKVLKCWVCKILKIWDNDLGVGDLVSSSYIMSSNQRSTEVCRGVVDSLTKGVVNVRFEDGRRQLIPMGWIEQIHPLGVGDGVLSHMLDPKGAGDSSSDGDTEQPAAAGTEAAHVDWDGGAERAECTVEAWAPVRAHGGDSSLSNPGGGGGPGAVSVARRPEDGKAAGSVSAATDGAPRETGGVRMCKSAGKYPGTIVGVSGSKVRVLFDNLEVGTVDKMWVEVHTRFKLKVRDGDLVIACYKKSEIKGETPVRKVAVGKRSVAAEKAVVKYVERGFASVLFEDEVEQRIPLGWIKSVVHMEPGAQVLSNYFDQGEQKSARKFFGTVISCPSTSWQATVMFDNMSVQTVEKFWLEVLSRFELDLVPGDLVQAHFAQRVAEISSGDGFESKSTQTERAVLSKLSPRRGMATLIFEDDVRQEIPLGWITSVLSLAPEGAPRGTNKRRKTSQDGGDRSSGRAEGEKEKRARAQQAEQMCIICTSSKRTAVMVHGLSCHQCACYGCALKILEDNGKCPVCRLPVDKVCKIFS